MKTLHIALALPIFLSGTAMISQEPAQTPAAPVPVTGEILRGEQAPGKPLNQPLGQPLQVAPRSAATPAQNAGPTAANLERYRLQPGDSISVRYRLTPEYNQTTSLQPDGTVTLRLLGPVALEGMTAAEARSRLQELATKRLTLPEVSVDLLNVSGPHFTVMGEVGKPGRYVLRGPLTVEDALAVAGGLSTGARHTKIVLVHRISATVGATQLIDVRQLENPKLGTELIAMQPDDILVVPKSKLANVERYVKLPNVGAGVSFPFYPGANK